MAKDYEQIMTILEKARNDELECAKVGEKLLKKIWNPIMHFRTKQSIARFREHAVGIDLAIYKLKKELES